MRVKFSVSESMSVTCSMQHGRICWRTRTSANHIDWPFMLMLLIKVPANICIVVLLYFSIFVRMYFCMFVCLYFCSFVLLYFCIFVFLYFCTFVLVHFCTFVLFCFCTFFRICSRYPSIVEVDFKLKRKMKFESNFPKI